MPFVKSSQLRSPLLMEVNCSLKLQQTFKCCRQHGVITTPQHSHIFDSMHTERSYQLHFTMLVVRISDVEVTQLLHFIQKVEGRSEISIIADQGFTIKDQLHEIGISLNIPTLKGVSSCQQQK